ncbi:stonustoxin subunit beta-like [Anarrhichthys ocellatus]|uniref:stonustoxin subunit beta-like n=1 Tax=Anarrhichthys ocellatus TaxID=433405 RepID=UPI0012EE791A|nr:stonustoxin subunit beta-like [Anarrhichthys ocellatus]XP_031699322.1 stonustoxin subunit beta-like [Anarrhichthys ocellatus]
MASDLNVAALGRPFSLGTLYNARKDLLIPGLTLWDDTTLQEKITESVLPYSHFQMTDSDTIESKSSLLDVEPSLKASFLCGLIEVGGSAKYLNHQKKFKNQSRVTCQYKSTSHFKELSMIDLLTLNTHQMEVIKKSSATHVVTRILYGANSFFVFDSEKLDTSSIQDIQGNMKAAINKIPSYSVEEQASIKMTDEEKALTNKCSCKFFGDFLLKSIPVTFQEAVKTCGQLPQLLGEKGENAVPMKVWLMPLNNFFLEADELMSGISVGLVGKMQEADELMNEISVGLVGKMQDALEDLSEIRMRCNDSLEDGVVENFPCIHEEFKTFQKLCDRYASDLKHNMAKKLPSIREGKEDERSLEELFDNREKSPFTQEKLSKWLDDKEREINVIRSCVDTMEGVKIVRNQSELDREVLDGDVDHALCFVFTSMIRGDTDLDVMATYLDSTKIRSTNEDQWFFSDEVFTTMREKAKAFRDLARAQKNNKRFRFLITGTPNEKYKGATIYHYKKGILVSEDFLEPDLHSQEITDKRDLIWYACDLTLDPNTAQNNLILSDGNKKATFTSVIQSYSNNPERFLTYTQVMCTEELSGRHYWEVEWNHASTTKKYIYAAVAYKRIDRVGPTSRLGYNTISWAFGQNSKSGNLKLEAHHNGKLMETDFPSDGCKTLGVYLDWPAGTLSFYKVSSDTLSHLHTFHTTFTEPVYPGFWAHYTNNYVYLRPVQ